MFRKIPFLYLIAIVLIAIGISIFDFSCLSWQCNQKSYLAIIFGILIIVFQVFSKRGQTL